VYRPARSFAVLATLAVVAAACSSSPAAPSPKNWPIKHVIILFKENRSFDNLFGRFPGANGTTTGMSHGQKVTLSLATDTVAGDLPHHHPDYVRDLDGGKIDGFARNGFVAQAAYSQFSAVQLANYYRWAHDFVLADNFFSSEAGPSFPNHLFLIGGQSGGAHDDPIHDDILPGRTRVWGCDAAPAERIVVDSGSGTQQVRPCFDFPTVGDRLNAAGEGWSFYSSTPLQKGYLWSAYDAVNHIRTTSQWSQHVRPVDNLVADIKAGKLPAVTWVTPRFEDSEHPKFRTSLCQGQNWIDAGRGRRHAEFDVEGHGDLRDVGRVGRVLRPRQAAGGGRVRAGVPRAAAGDLDPTRCRATSTTNLGSSIRCRTSSRTCSA